MYCRNCGKEVAEKAEICLNCGVNPMNGANYCSHCGNAVSPNAEICIKCGVRLSGVSIVGATSLHYAGFWLRFVASFIDGLILFIPILILNALFSYSGWFVGSIASWLYYALMESSDKQATLGKQAMKICVTDMQ